MAKYTMELRELCEWYSRDTIKSWFSDYELSDFLTDDEIAVINERGTWSKSKLADDIIDFYYMREIGFESDNLFKLHVKARMKMIMESKLPLIYSAAISYDPLVNVDVTTTVSRRVDDAGNNTSSGVTVNSDTPQGEITKANILAGTYASSTQGGESTASTTSQTIESSSTNTKGNSGVSATAQKMIEQYRQNIRAINYEIIKELNILFMGLY